MPLTLGIDASTQSCSAMVINTDSGAIVAEASINFGQDLAQYQAPSGFIPNGPDGEVHSDPLMWLDALELLLSELGKKCDLSEISAVSGAGQQHGSVYLKESWFETIRSLEPAHSLSQQIGPCLSRKTSPIWMDVSTGPECQEIADTVGGNARVCEKSGSIAIERFTGPQIRRFYKSSPAAYASTARIHLVSSFLCSILCASDAPIDTGDGAGMNLANIHTWEWDAELLNATAPDLAQRLPALVPGSHIVGGIAPYFVSKFGFNPNAIVNVFTGDNPSSLIGMGASQPGKVVISLGTSDTFFAAMPEVVADPKGCGHVFGNPTGGSMSLQCFVNGSLAREAVKDKFKYNWEQFSSALEDTRPGNEGNVMVPFFRPEISPRIDLKAPLLSGTEAFLSWKDGNSAIRACVEGQFLNMKLRSEWMQLKPEVIYITGGASKNDAMAQVIADIFQVKVQRLSTQSSVALGGALRAASNCLQLNLNQLEHVFCKVEQTRVTSPKVDAETFEANAKIVYRLLHS